METQVLKIDESIYDRNRTMKLIGKQYPTKILGPDSFKDIDQILNARPYSCTIDTALDIFMLGYMYGKRAERLRRKGGK